MTARTLEVHPSQFGVPLHDFRVTEVVHLSTQIIQIFDPTAVLKLLLQIMVMIAVELQRQITVLVDDVRNAVLGIVREMQFRQIHFAVWFLDAFLQLGIVAQ